MSDAEVTDVPQVVEPDPTVIEKNFSHFLSTGKKDVVFTFGEKKVRFRGKVPARAYAKLINNSTTAPSALVEKFVSYLESSVVSDKEELYEVLDLVDPEELIQLVNDLISQQSNLDQK